MGTGEGSRSASEFMNELMQDPEYVRRLREEEARNEADEAAGAEEVRPLLEDLERVGVHAASAWDIPRSLPDVAVPILLEHLSRPYDTGNRDDIARSLEATAARPHWPAVLARYRTEDDEQVKEGLASALSSLATADHLVALEQVLWDDGSPSTVILTVPFQRHARRGGKEALERLLEHPQAAEEAARCLARIETNERRRQRRAAQQ